MVLALYSVIKHFTTDDDVDSDHQTSLELSSYSLSDNGSHGNVNSQPHLPIQDPVTSTNTLEKQTSHESALLCSSTPLKAQLYLPLKTPATPTCNVDSLPRKIPCSSSPLTNAPSKASTLLSKDHYDDVIDLTQSDNDDSDVTYCSAADDDVYIDSEASLNPTSCDHCTASCHSNDLPSSLPPANNDQCTVLPATPEHSTVRSNSIILSYHGTL